MKLCIIIPIHNEQKTIKQVIDAVFAQIPELEKEVIVVDDCSTDNTSQILTQIPNIKIITRRKNGGKSKAIKDGTLQSTGDILIIQNADLEYNPKDYPDLLSPIINNQADVVYGSRFISSKPRRIIYFHNFLANQLITFLSNLTTGLNLSDVETGYKAFRAELIRQIAPTLRSQGFEAEIELTAKIAKRKIRVYEVGIQYHGRTKQEGKHIRATDGLKALIAIFKYKFIN